MEVKLVKESLAEERAEALNGKKGFVTNIEEDTIQNEDFRRVLYTGEHLQLVLMTLQPGEDIGEEVHAEVDQFFRIDEGDGAVIINGQETPIKDGSGFIVPAGAKHNILNTGDAPLRLYSLYGPPNHKDLTVHETKEDAEADNEHFDGETTEM